MAIKHLNLIAILTVTPLFWICLICTDVFAGFCDPLPPPTGSSRTVSSEADLRYWAYNADAGTNIIIDSGTYNMTSYIHIVNDGVSLRGASGNRDEVVLDFGGMITGYFGILVDSNDSTIADLTIRNTRDHGVSIQGRDRPVLYNLHIIDSNDQLVKVNPAGNGSEDGILACSLLEYTTTAPDGYTNGISAHNAHRWTVRDNVWNRIRTNSDDIPVQTILFWSGSSDTVIERNLLIDCSRGIAFGDSSHGENDHIGGIVRNNVIFNRLPHDTAIEMVHATGWVVAHNTVMLTNPLPGLNWGIEARFSDTSGIFYNNLTNMNIWPDRGGANGTAGPDNITDAVGSWFVDEASLDSRLNSRGWEAIDQGSTAALALVGKDYHGQLRDSKPDIGADEWLPGLTDVITILQTLSGAEVTSELVIDINGDSQTGMAEVIFILTRLSPLE